jgi:hypothetical protein
VTDAERLVRKFELAYTDTDIKLAMANEILVLLDLIEKAQKNQSHGYMRKRVKHNPKYVISDYPDPIDDSWIKTGASNE